jgi:hypothetical protein
MQMISLDLTPNRYYSKVKHKDNFDQFRKLEGVTIMKLAIRIAALVIVFAAIAAASVSTSSARTVPSQQSATGGNPIPLCAPGLPTCPDLPPVK